MFDGSNFSTSLPTLIACGFFYFFHSGNPSGCEVVLICLFLTTNLLILKLGYLTLYYWVVIVQRMF